MRLFRRGKRFVLACPYPERHIPKSSSFRFDFARREWYTTSRRRAARFRHLADPALREELRGVAPTGRLTPHEIGLACRARYWGGFSGGLTREGPGPEALVARDRGATFRRDGAVYGPADQESWGILEDTIEDFTRWLGFERVEDYAAECAAAGPAVLERATY